jgi:hypothetical protein
MRSEPRKNKPIIPDEPVDQHQIGLYMAVPVILPIVRQGMIPVARL